MTCASDVKIRCKCESSKFFSSSAEVPVRHLRYLRNSNPLDWCLWHRLSSFSRDQSPTNHGDERERFGLGLAPVSFVSSAQPYPAISCAASPFPQIVGRPEFLYDVLDVVVFALIQTFETGG